VLQDILVVFFDSTGTFIQDFRVKKIKIWNFKINHCKAIKEPSITPETGLSPIKSTIAENGMGMTSRP